MSWFEAYMLWNLGVIGKLFITLAILGTGWLVVCVVLWVNQLDYASIYEDSTYEDGKRKFTKHTLIANRWQGYAKRTLKFIPVIIILFIVGVLTPPTETLLKIIATKKGIDVIQSDTGTKYLNEVDKAVSNGLKVLNREIEKKLDKKEVK